MICQSKGHPTWTRACSSQIWSHLTLLWCFYKLSSWRHPFTAEHPLLSDAMLHFSKSEKKQTHLHLAWPEDEHVFSRVIRLKHTDRVQYSPVSPWVWAPGRPSPPPCVSVSAAAGLPHTAPPDEELPASASSPSCGSWTSRRSSETSGIAWAKTLTSLLLTKDAFMCSKIQ